MEELKNLTEELLSEINDFQSTWDDHSVLVGMQIIDSIIDKKSNDETQLTQLTRAHLDTSIHNLLIQSKKETEKQKKHQSKLQFRNQGIQQYRNVKMYDIDNWYRYDARKYLKQLYSTAKTKSLQALVDTTQLNLAQENASLHERVAKAESEAEKYKKKVRKLMRTNDQLEVKSEVQRRSSIASKTLQNKIDELEGQMTSLQIEATHLRAENENLREEVRLSQTQTYSVQEWENEMTEDSKFWDANKEKIKNDMKATREQNRRLTRRVTEMQKLLNLASQQTSERSSVADLQATPESSFLSSALFTVPATTNQSNELDSINSNSINLETTPSLDSPDLSKIETRPKGRNMPMDGRMMTKVAIQAKIEDKIRKRLQNSIHKRRKEAGAKK